MDTKHPAQKAQADLVKAEEAFQHYQSLVASCAVEAPADITKTPAYLKLKDAQRAAAFFQVGCAAMDDTAKIDTTLTEGMRTLQAEGFQLAPCDLIAQALMTRHLDAVA